jgi:hypothetical protein
MEYPLDDPYLNDKLCADRLVENWRAHNCIIIAFDFDNVIYDYYNKGYTYTKVINLLKECKSMGCTLILSTCCDESKNKFMLDYCESVGIKVDYVNQSPPYIPFTGDKIYYNILLDDRAGLSSAYRILYEAKERIANEDLRKQWTGK